MGKPTATGIRNAKEPGRHGDGDGLFFNIGRTGSKSWIVRVQKAGRRRDIGLGSASKVSLADARARAAKVRSEVEADLDPVAERRKAEGIPTFGKAAAWSLNKTARHGATAITSGNGFAHWKCSRFRPLAIFRCRT